MRPLIPRLTLGAALTLFLFSQSACTTTEGPCEAHARPGAKPPALLATLPPSCPTPDGLAIAEDGSLVVACPNYADQSKPACLIKIDQATHAVTHWVDVPVLPETGVACPMGIDFGTDGDLYVCDNQGWKGTPQGQFKGRILRLKIEGGQVVRTTVVAEGMEHPNGVRVHNEALYVTQSLMTRVKHPSGLMVSAVYRFRTDDTGVKVGNTLSDPNILTTFVTEHRFCQYGVDGLVFDSKGNLFVGNFGDGALHKVTLDASGKVTGNTVFAKTDHDTSLDPKQPGFLAKATRAKMRTTDGICIDAQDNIYVADFSNNAVVKVAPGGVITVLWQNGDCDGRNGWLNEPGEPIVWNGKLAVSNFDAVFGPDHTDKVNTKHDLPSTLSLLPLK